MSERIFEQPGRDPDDALEAPDLEPLRAAAEQEELAEARTRLADSLGNPLPAVTRMRRWRATWRSR